MNLSMRYAAARAVLDGGFARQQLHNQLGEISV